METFTALKQLVDNPYYPNQRQEYLSKLDLGTIDAPISDIVIGLIELPYCFTIQSCYGHFIYKNQNDFTNIDPLPVSDNIIAVEYRIAYIALCIQNNDLGRQLLNELSEIPSSIDIEYI